VIAGLPLIVMMMLGDDGELFPFSLFYRVQLSLVEIGLNHL